MVPATNAPSFLIPCVPDPAYGRAAPQVSGALQVPDGAGPGQMGRRVALHALSARSSHRSNPPAPKRRSSFSRPTPPAGRRGEPRGGDEAAGGCDRRLLRPRVRLRCVGPVHARVSPVHGAGQARRPRCAARRRRGAASGSGGGDAAHGRLESSRRGKKQGGGTSTARSSPRPLPLRRWRTHTVFEKRFALNGHWKEYRGRLVQGTKELRGGPVWRLTCVPSSCCWGTRERPRAEPVRPAVAGRPALTRICPPRRG